MAGDERLPACAQWCDGQCTFETRGDFAGEGITLARGSAGTRLVWLQRKDQAPRSGTGGVGRGWGLSRDRNCREQD